MSETSPRSTTRPVPAPSSAFRPARLARDAATACLLAAFAASASAQPAAPEDWPCVQVLVPEVSVATLWPVALEPAATATWREDAELAVVARRFAALEDGDEAAFAEAEAALAELVAATPEAEREIRLGRLAAGTVELVNERRADYIDGIRRFTRGQIALADRLESLFNQLADREGAAGVGADAIALSRADSGAARTETEDALHWQERLYDQRERQVRALCERPVRLEETLSRSLRTFALSLPEPG